MASNVWQDLLVLDCDGGVTLMGTNPLLQAKIGFGVQGLYQWFTDRLYERYSTCDSCNAGKTEFLCNFDITSVDYWINQIQANPQTTDSCPNSPFQPTNMNMQHITFGPFTDNGCTLSNYENGNPCLLQLTPDVGATGIKFQFAFQKCSPTSNWPYVSLSCTGDGCKTFGAPCNTDSECSGTQICYTIPGTNTDSFLSSILTDMNLFDSNDGTDCYSGYSYFVDIISLVRLKMFNLTTPYSFGTPATYRMCFQENLLTLNDTTQFGCSVSNNSKISCSKINTWNGVLDDGTSVTASNRLNGVTDVAFAPTIPTIPEDSSKPAVTLLYADCSNEYGVFPAIDGISAGSILVINSVLSMMSGNSSDMSYLPYAGLAVAGVSTKFKIPPLNILSNKFWGETYIVEACRAAALKGSLSINAFKARFMWIPDAILYAFTTPTISLTYAGPEMSDWTIPYDGPKLVMPNSCSYNTWISTGQCSFEYTGLQSILQSDVTIRVVLQSCSGFSLPKFTLDCSGTACPLISNAQKCTTSASCPTGTVCWDFADVLNSQNKALDALGAFLNWGDTSNACTGKSYFVSDMESLLYYIIGDGGSDDVKYCFWNVTSIADRLSSSGNMTQWLQDQFFVDGDTATNIFIQNWFPNYPPSQPSSVTFTVTLSSLPANIDTLSNYLVTILVQNGFIPGTFTVTVTSTTKKRSSTVQFLVTSNDPQVTTSIASQIQDPTTTISNLVTTQIGAPDTSSVTTSGVNSPTGSPTGNSPTGNSPTGNSPTGNSPTRNSPTGNSPTGNSPTGNSPTGNSPTGNSPTGNSPTRNSPTGNSPTGNSPTGNSPTGNSPTGNSPTGNSPTGNSPTGNSPSPAVQLVAGVGMMLFITIVTIF